MITIKIGIYINMCDINAIEEIESMCHSNMIVWELCGLRLMVRVRVRVDVRVCVRVRVRVRVSVRVRVRVSKVLGSG